MLKRIVILSLFSFFLCGCTAQYNLEIKDDEFRENIKINFDSNDQGAYEYFSENKFYAIMDGVSNFKEYKKENENKENINFSYTYEGLEFNKATSLSSCFEAYNVMDENGYYIISTSKGLTCAREEDTILLDDLDVVIKTNHIVKENNADEVDGYIYTWHFDKNNYDKKSIYIELEKDKYVFNYENEFVKELLLYFSIIGIIVGVSIFMLVRFKKKNKKNNEI